jgi:hypothetical protein
LPEGQNIPIKIKRGLLGRFFSLTIDFIVELY